MCQVRKECDCSEELIAYIYADLILYCFEILLTFFKRSLLLVTIFHGFYFLYWKPVDFLVQHVFADDPLEAREVCWLLELQVHNEEQIVHLVMILLHVLHEPAWKKVDVVADLPANEAYCVHVIVPLFIFLSQVSQSVDDNA